VKGDLIMKNDWDIVAAAFEDDAPECQEGCEFFGYDYATDTGADAWCELGNMSGHDPKWCPAFDRVFKEMMDA